MLFNNPDLKKNAAVLLFYILIAIVFFYQLIFGGLFFFNEDNRDLFYPNKYISQKIISNREFPLWDRFRFSGESFLAEIQSQNLYPPYYVFDFLPVEQRINYLTLLHFVLSGFFMFLLMKKIIGSDCIALISGVMFMFTGMFGQALKDSNYGIISTLCWLPAVIHSFLLILENPKLKYVSLFSIIVSLQILAGHLQFVFYTHIIIFLIFLYSFFCETQNRFLKIRNYCLSGILAFLIVSVQLFPTLEFAKDTPRAEGSSFRYSTGLSLKPDQIITFALADFFGDKEFNFFGPSTTYYGGYCGIIVLLFSLYFFISAKKNNKFLLLGILFFSIFFSLGKFNPLYVYVLKLPGFNIFRAPTRFLTIFSFALIFSSCLGITQFIKTRKTYNLFYLFPLFSLSIIILINIFESHAISLFQNIYNEIYSAGYRSLWLNYFVENKIPDNAVSIMSKSLFAFFVISSAFAAMLKIFSFRKFNVAYFYIITLLLIICDLWFVDLKLLSFSLSPKTEILSFQNFADFIRKNNDNRCLFRVDAAYHIKYSWNSYYGFEDVLGRTATISKEYLDYIGSVSRGNNFFKMLNIKYIVQPDDYDIDLNIFSKCLSENGNSLYEYEDFFPRFSIVKKFRLLDNKDEIYNIVKSDSTFVPEKEILLLKEDKKAAENLNADPVLNSCYKILEYDNNRIKLKVESSVPAIMLWSNKYSKNWKVFINSKPAEIYRANWMFSCFSIPEGNSVVELDYSPQILTLSILLSLCGLLVAFIFIIL
ncbi:MAG TPA: YfhO family protein [bacterium]|nr:YfhO family protein [bacterium]HPN30956.1 YfhO family protein [bacterium]